MQVTPSLLKFFTNFTLGKFEKLVELVVTTIINHASFARESHHAFGWPSKLTPIQCLLSFILFVKHDNVIKYDAFIWNWNKSVINDDGIVFCILHQFCHCWWNSLAHYWAMTSFGDIAFIIPGLALDLLMGHSLKSISLGIIFPIASLMCKKHEQHGPLWVVHIFRPWILKVILWC